MCHVSVLDAALRVFVVCRGWLTRHSLDNRLQRGAWRARGAPFLHPFPAKAGVDQEQRWAHIHLLTSGTGLSNAREHCLFPFFVTVAVF